MFTIHSKFPLWFYWFVLFVLKLLLIHLPFQEVVTNSGIGMCWFAESYRIPARRVQRRSRTISWDRTSFDISFGSFARNETTTSSILRLLPADLSSNKPVGFGLLGLRMDHFQTTVIDSPCALRFLAPVLLSVSLGMWGRLKYQRNQDLNWFCLMRQSWCMQYSLTFDTWYKSNFACFALE